MGPAISLLIFSILSLTAFIIIIICLKKNHCYRKFMFFCILISFILSLLVISPICRICCILNTTITEATKKYEIIDMEKVDFKYHIAYIDNDVAETTTTDNVYEILEISETTYDLNKKAFLKENDYIVKIDIECSMSEIIQKIAWLPKDQNIRVYTCDEELLGYYTGNISELFWIILAIIAGVCCILLTIGMAFDMKKHNFANKN